MIKPGMDIEEIRAQGVAGSILSLDPPLVMDHFAMYYPDTKGFESSILKAVKGHGTWEAEVTKYIMDESANGGKFLDVGAHLGYFGFVATATSGGLMEVHSFEPSNDMCNAMEETLQYNNWGFEPKFKIYRYALSNKGGERVILRGPEGDSGSSTMVTGDHEGPNGVLNEDAFSVSFDGVTARLDDLHLSGFTLMKMDVEGFEWEAWQGMRETIASSPGLKVVIETGAYHPKELREEWRKDFDEFVFDYDGSVVPAPEGYLDIVPSTNAILVKRS